MQTNKPIKAAVDQCKQGTVFVKGICWLNSFSSPWKSAVWQQSKVMKVLHRVWISTSGHPVAHLIEHTPQVWKAESLLQRPPPFLFYLRLSYQIKARQQNDTSYWGWVDVSFWEKKKWRRTQMYPPFNDTLTAVKFKSTQITSTVMYCVVLWDLLPTTGTCKWQLQLLITLYSDVYMQ